MYELSVYVDSVVLTWLTKRAAEQGMTPAEYAGHVLADKCDEPALVGHSSV